MKILHIDETFHPSYGYQCNPLAKFQRQDGNEVYIIAPEAKYMHSVYHDFGDYGENLAEEDRIYEQASGVKVVRVAGKGFIAGRLNYNMSELYRAIEKIAPDSIMVHCIETLTAMRLIWKLKNKYPMVFDSHMLSMASKNRFAKIYEKAYRLLITSVVKKQKYMVIKTQNDDYVTSHLGIPKEQTKFISFGTDTMLFYPDENAKKEFLKKEKLPEDAFVIISTGKLSEAKDGMLFANAMKEKFDTNRAVVIVVVADFSGKYESSVKNVLDKSENVVIYYPVQKYLNLPWFYQIADVTIFPKQCSMSFYDAQSCGVPVISEKGHVNEERNSHGNGLCFECGSVNDLRNKINEMINMPQEAFLDMKRNSCQFVRENYSYEQIAAEYTKELERARKQFFGKRNAVK